MRKVKKRLKMSKFERLIYTFTFIMLVVSPLVLVFSKATFSKVNYDVECVKKNISIQERKNESLTMKINELASLEKIQEVAKEQGLSYNNNNIRVVQDNND